MGTGKAFDAIETYLCEVGDKPLWRTVSLVTAMHGILRRGREFQHPTIEARRAALHAVAEELSRRGLDAVALARYGMGTDIVGSLIAALLIKVAFSEEGLLDGVDIEGWCSALGLEGQLTSSERPSVSELSDVLRSEIVPVVPHISNWVITASLDDLLELKPPPPGALTGTSPEMPDPALTDQYRWAVDHFSTTFYSEWATPSLHYEFRWLRGEVTPPCPPELMSDREISVDKVATEVASRTVSQGKTDPLSDATLVLEMTRHARQLLSQGRHREAAAVFEFGVYQRPDSAEIRNNLGFCLIPVDPEGALLHLQKAVDMGYKSSINAYNQMCCYVTLRRPRAAINVAESAWKSDKEVVGATLWEVPSSEGWKTFESSDPRKSLAQFAARVASDEGWREEALLWQERAAE